MGAPCSFYYQMQNIVFMLWEMISSHVEYIEFVQNQ